MADSVSRGNGPESKSYSKPTAGPKKKIAPERSPKPDKRKQKVVTRMNLFSKKVIATYWSDYLRAIRTFLACAATAMVCCCATEGGDSLLETEVVEGIPVTASFTIGASDAPDITVTKSVSSTSHSTIISFVLFIFSANGDSLVDVCNTEDNTLTLTATGTTGVYNIAFDSTTGNRRLLGIANYPEQTIWTGRDSEEKEISLKDYISSIIDNASSYTFDGLYEEISYLNGNYYEKGYTPDFSAAGMLMSGDAYVTIDASGKVTTTDSSDNTMYMYRPVASIVFNISASTHTKDSGNKVTFTPYTYTIYNIPKGVRFEPNRDKPVSNWTESDEEGTADFYYDSSSSTVPAASGDYYTFSFFMPENLQADADLQKTINSENKYSDYATRDAFDGTYDSSGKKKWYYAPQYATYVVIHGNYVETDSSGTTVNYSGTASYTIHLGDFSQSNNYNYADYTVRRNYQYIYNVTVQGVDDIITEVTKSEDPSPGAEGNILHMEDASLNYVLDAHFEQVLLVYNLSNIAQVASTTIAESGCSQQEAIGMNMLLSFESPFQDKAIELEPYTIYSEAESAEAGSSGTAKTNALASVDYKWVEFWPQTESTIQAYPGVPAWNSLNGNNATNNSTYLLDAYDACVAMGKVVAQIMNGETPTTGSNRNADGIFITESGGEYYAYFTGFIGEYYYYKDPITGNDITWEDFANEDARRMIICMDSQISTDRNSSYSTIHTSVSQCSIQTFYDEDKASSLSGFGIETYNESNWWSSYGTTANSNYTSDDWDGRANQIGMFGLTTGGSSTLQWKTYINTTGNGRTSSVTAGNGDDTRILSNAYKQLTSGGGRPGSSTQKEGAWLACLNRNRDLDGDGIIDEDEIYWYLPSVNEYTIIQLGEQCLTNESVLYYGDKSEMDISGYPDSYIKSGALYYTSCSGVKRIFWAVERASYGTDAYYSNLPIRCARRLPGNDLTKYNQPIDEVGEVKTTADNNYLLDFSDYFEPNTYRTSRITIGALVPHNEDDAANKLYKAIVLSKGNSSFDDEGLKKGYVKNTLWNIAYYDEGDNPCAAYYEKSDTSDLNTWRPMNLSEMVIMTWNYTTLIDSDLISSQEDPSTSWLACGTKFSNRNVRYGFFYTYGSHVHCDYNHDKNDNELNSYNYYVRCVRDATDDEIENATTN